MLTFGIDWDDVIAPLNKYAIELANRKHDFNPPLALDEINSWENNGRTAVIKKLYNDPRLYSMQKVPEESIEFLNKLRIKGEVYIITSVFPRFMAKRVQQIKEAFPDFPDENIIMGSEKSLFHVDILLDDKPDNILKSSARFPVLMRRPWNQELTGVLAVHDFDEFFQMLDQIKTSMVEDRIRPEAPCVVALVGPSGSEKNVLVEELCENTKFCTMASYTTKTDAEAYSKKGTHFPITEEEFKERREEFLETTRYAGYGYGIRRCDLTEILGRGKYIVIPMDISGAVTLKRHAPTVIIFCKRKREKMIEDILKKKIDDREKTLRLVSMENELKNARLCDFVVRTDDVADAVEQIEEICK